MNYLLKIPFNADNMFAYWQAHTTEIPISLREYNNIIPKWLDHLVLSMLAKIPTERTNVFDCIDIINSNSTKNIEGLLGGYRQSLLDIAIKEYSDEAKGKIEQILKELHAKVSFYSPSLQVEVRKVMLSCEELLVKIKVEQNKPVINREFDPLTCPNLECNYLLKKGLTSCPRCNTSWLITCVCKKQLLTPFMRDKCQKCRDRHWIKISHKKVYALLCTTKLLKEKGEYEKALLYHDLLGNFFGDDKVSEDKKILMELYRKELGDKVAQVLNSIKESQKSINDEEEKENQRQHNLKQEELAKQRQQYVVEMQSLIDMESYNDAYDYYKNSFPESLKNDDAKNIFEEVCFKITESDIDEITCLYEDGKNKEALKIIRNLRKDYDCDDLRDWEKEVLFFLFYWKIIELNSKKRYEASYKLLLKSKSINLELSDIYNEHFFKSYEYLIAQKCYLQEQLEEAVGEKKWFCVYTILDELSTKYPYYKDIKERRACILNKGIYIKLYFKVFSILLGFRKEKNKIFKIIIKF